MVRTSWVALLALVSATAAADVRTEVSFRTGAARVVGSADARDFPTTLALVENELVACYDAAVPRSPFAVTPAIRRAAEADRSPRLGAQSGEVRFVIEADGQVTAVTSRFATSAAVARCLAAQVARLRFEPASDDKRTTVVLPVSFEWRAEHDAGPGAAFARSGFGPGGGAAWGRVGKHPRTER